MAKGEMQPLSGFRDDLPEEMIPKRKMLETIAEVFESFGFAPLDTPVLEKAAVLVGKYGGESDKLLYRFRDHGDRDIALRYELTVPLARVVASHSEIPMPFKRYQIGKVWRGERPGRGRFREFMQCDVDTLGSSSMVADTECLQVICAVLTALGVPDFEVRVSNRRLLNAVLAEFGVVETGPVQASLRALDKLEKIGSDRVRGLLTESAGWGEKAAAAFLAKVEGGLDEIRDSLPEDDPGLTELTELLELAAAAGIEEKIVVDPTIARGLDYYTGTVFETFLTDLPDMGSVMSGGRYDDLLRLLCGRDLPGVGVSLGISRLMSALGELELIRPRRTPARALVTYFGPETARETFACADGLRRAGIPTEVYPGPAKLGKQFRYADRLGVKAVCVIGPDEAAAGTVRVKILATGEQREVTLEALPAVIEEIG